MLGLALGLELKELRMTKHVLGTGDDVIRKVAELAAA
jgi:hypothetical protein